MSSVSLWQCTISLLGARGDLQVLTTRTVTYVPHSFVACASKLWNSLPTTLRHSTLTFTVL